MTNMHFDKVTTDNMLSVTEGALKPYLRDDNAFITSEQIVRDLLNPDTGKAPYASRFADAIIYPMDEPTAAHEALAAIMDKGSRRLRAAEARTDFLPQDAMDLDTSLEEVIASATKALATHNEIMDRMKRPDEKISDEKISRVAYEVAAALERLAQGRGHARA